MSEFSTQDQDVQVQETLKEFGTPTAVFQPSKLRLVIGMTFGGLLGVIGIGIIAGILVAGKNPLICLVGVGLLLAGAGLAWWVKRLAAFRVLVCPKGLVMLRATRVDTCPWDQIQEVNQIIVQDRMPLKGVAKHLAPAGKSRTYVVRRKDGRSFAFNADDVRGVSKLGGLIQAEATARGIP